MDWSNEAIYVTKPLLPPKERLVAALDGLYESGILTNMGPFHQKLEKRLHEWLGGEVFLLFNNGTVALMAALSALDLPPGSEVITTPFSFAATTHAITALGFKPVFADIDPVYMTLCPQSVEEKITEATSCILGVHVYGYPCDVDGLDKIAKAYKLKTVYDCAHAVGLKLNGKDISSYGDASAFSFHATKLFNTVEGGGLALNSSGQEQLARDYRNFGIRSEDHVATVGLNGKLSELHAIFGLLNLEVLENEISNRVDVATTYYDLLQDCPYLSIVPFPTNAKPSFQYFPVRILRGRELVYERLKEKGIFSRRYFYPLIADFDCYNRLPSAAGLPEARKAASEVLCLPFYGDLCNGNAARIALEVRSILSDIASMSPLELMEA